MVLSERCGNVVLSESCGDSGEEEGVGYNSAHAEYSLYLLEHDFRSNVITKQILKSF